MSAIEIPPHLLEQARAGPERLRDWVRDLPETIAELRDRWGLEIGPAYDSGSSAWVAPARDGSGRALALKVGWRHPEARHEAEGLRLWGGEGTVRLHGALELGAASALLLERCDPGTPLGDLEPEPVQDEVVAGLLRRLWGPAPQHGPLRPLEEMTRMWADELEGRLAAHPGRVPAQLADRALETLRRPSTVQRRVVLFTDLHAGNVLAAGREPWLAIDPKPYVGDPAYDTVQHMLNCRRRLERDPLALASRMAELTACELERVLEWLFARCVQEAFEDQDLIDVARAVDR